MASAKHEPYYYAENFTNEIMEPGLLFIWHPTISFWLSLKFEALQTIYTQQKESRSLDYFTHL